MSTLTNFESKCNVLLFCMASNRVKHPILKKHRINWSSVRKYKVG